MTAYPHTIDNGGGDRLTFVGIAHDERGEYLEIRNTVAPAAGPPMHVHHLQEEGLNVERGTMGYEVLMVRLDAPQRRQASGTVRRRISVAKVP
jgi:hypothetical protein